MFRKRTVFVLGAGAGADIGMPLGLQLAQQIAGAVTNTLSPTRDRLSIADQGLNYAFTAAAKSSGVSGDQFLSACGTISRGLLLSPSIDEYLYAHSNDKPVQILGKLAIARAIARAEQNSLLYYNRNETNVFEMSRIANSWLLPFFKLIQRRIRQGDEARVFEGFTIVNFNYDRCLEHFLFHAVRDYFNVNDKRAADVLHTLNIFHPYGSIAPLDWQDVDFSVPFGIDLEGENCVRAASQLRTFTEEINDPNQLKNVRRTLEEAEYIIFVGFHYHLQNLVLLCEGGRKLTARRIFGTVLDRSSEDVAVIRRRLSRFVQSSADPNSINLINLNCLTTFQQYALSWGNFVEPD